MTKRRLMWVGTRIVAQLALASLVLVLWFYLAVEESLEIDPETGLAIPEISQVQPPPGFFEQVRVWLGW